MSINTCTISGNLTRDAELRSTRGGTNVLTFGVAVNDRRKNPQTGEWEDVPNFIDCCLFGPRADKLSTMMLKGTKVCVIGKLRWSQWDSNGQRRSKVEVVADDIELMSRHKADGQDSQQQTGRRPQSSTARQNSASQGPQGQRDDDLYDSDIPF